MDPREGAEGRRRDAPHARGIRLRRIQPRLRRHALVDRCGRSADPAWYPATLYSRKALETLYSRFRLAEMRAEPTLRIEADRARGVFALRFAGPGGTLVAPVDAYAVGGGTATLGARAGERTAQVSIRLGGDGSIPYEVRVEGLGPQWDRAYSPAGAWRGAGRQVFLGAEDELASEDLVGIWADPAGRTTPIAIEGEPPYRIRVGKESLLDRPRRRGPSVRRVAHPPRRRRPSLGHRSEGPERARTHRSPARASPPGRPAGPMARRRRSAAPGPGSTSVRTPGRPERRPVKPANLRLDKDLRWNSRP